MPLTDYFFDLDGTLLDTVPDIGACMKSALAENGVAVDNFQRRFVIGPPLADAVRDFLPGVSDEIVQKVIERFKYSYDTSCYPLTQAYEHVDSVLNQLYKSGNRLYIATNKRRFPTDRLMEKFAWTRRFTDIITCDFRSDSSTPKSEMLLILQKKWGVLTENAVMIGDTKSDMDAGQAAGFHTFAVTWGYGTLEKLQQAKPDKILDNILDLF